MIVWTSSIFSKSSLFTFISKTFMKSSLLALVDRICYRFWPDSPLNTLPGFIFEEGSLVRMRALRIDFWMNSSFSLMNLVWRSEKDSEMKLSFWLCFPTVLNRSLTLSFIMVASDCTKGLISSLEAFKDITSSNRLMISFYFWNSLEYLSLSVSNSPILSSTKPFSFKTSSFFGNVNTYSSIDLISFFSTLHNN